MKIGLRSHNGAEDRLLFAQQIGAHGATKANIWIFEATDIILKHKLLGEEMFEYRKQSESYSNIHH